MEEEMNIPECLYVVIIEDRHSDVEVELYSDEIKAVERAKEICQEYSNGPEDINEYLTDDMKEEGWIYNATYSCESDGVSVIKKKIYWGR
jgi:hypothetical protein